MPQLTWTIDAADQSILDSLTKIEAAANRAAAAVKQVGSGAAGGAGAGGGAGASILQATQSQVGLTRMGAQVDSLLRKLQQLGQTRPEIRVNGQFLGVVTDIQRLQVRLTALAAQPYSVDVQLRTAELRADLAQAQRDLAAFTGSLPPVQRGLDAIGRSAAQHGPNVRSFFQGALEAATGFLAANVFQQIASGIADIGRGTVTAAANMERTRAAFTTLTGSAERANELIAAMQREANISPFQLESFRRAGQLLLGMGTAADQVVPRLHEVSNVVAAVGGSNEQFDRISLALSQIQAKGKVSAEEINQLAENGVPGWDILARALGKTRGEVLDLAEQSRISAEVFQQAFSQFANSPQIAQAAERQSHTFSGLVSTIHDIGYALEYSFGTPLIQTIEPTLERMVQGLQNPQVAATLAQWGQRAGDFVNWLIQAGQVAAQVGGEILGALQPVTNLLGQLFGSQTDTTTPKPPDFTASTEQAAQFSATVADGNAQMLQVRDQVAALEREQRAANRASDEQELTYKHQSDAIRDQIRALQEKYDLENRSADRAELVAKIAKDELLARDVYSSQGQAAAKRLVEERAQLRRLDRQSAFEAQKGALEDQQRGLDAQGQASREANATQRRALQERIDAIREGDTGGKNGLQLVDDPAVAAATRQYSQFYSGSAAQSQTWAETVKVSIAGVIAQLRQLGGAPGAVIGALLDDWKLLTGAWDGIGTHTGTIIAAVDRLATTLGARDGLEGVFIALRFEFERLMASLAAVAPTILSRLGNNFGELGDAVTETLDTINALAAVQKSIFDPSEANVRAAAVATAQIGVDKAKADARHAAFVASDAQTQGTFQDRIAAINRDIDARQAAAFREADARRGVPGPDFGMRPDYTQPGTYPQYGPGYNGPYSLPPQSGAAGQAVAVHVTVSADQNGLMTATARTITGKRLAKVLGDYASR